MDINEKLNELVIKFHVSDCVPEYQMYLKKFDDLQEQIENELCKSNQPIYIIKKNIRQYNTKGGQI